MGVSSRWLDRVPPDGLAQPAELIGWSRRALAGQLLARVLCRRSRVPTSCATTSSCRSRRAAVGAARCVSRGTASSSSGAVVTRGSWGCSRRRRHPVFGSAARRASGRRSWGPPACRMARPTWL